MDDVNIEFCAEYHHDGATWGLSIFAKDAADALAKIESMRSSLRLLGQLAMKARLPSDAVVATIVDAPGVH